MKTTRTRMLIVFCAAAVVISFFMHWDDFRSGFQEGFTGKPAPVESRR